MLAGVASLHAHARERARTAREWALRARKRGILGSALLAVNLHHVWLTMTKRREDSALLPHDRLLDLAFALVVIDWDSRRSPLAHSIAPPENANGATAAAPAPASER